MPLHSRLGNPQQPSPHYSKYLFFSASRKLKFAVYLGVFGLIASGLSACGPDADQIGQSTTYKQGRYQGKPDTQPYMSGRSPTSVGGGQWTPGDKMSWQGAIQQRQGGQDEYTRSPN